MRKMQVLPFTEEDRESLERWRTAFTDATLELSHDYTSPQVETAVVHTESGEIVLSLTGTFLAGLGPLIRNPNATRLEIMEALFLAEAALTYKAVGAGAVDASICVPNHMTDYIKTLTKLGYEVVATNCTILSRVLQHDKPLAEPLAESVKAGS
jgi:hypothetical protein